MKILGNIDEYFRKVILYIFFKQITLSIRFRRRRSWRRRRRRRRSWRRRRRRRRSKKKEEEEEVW